MSHGLRVVFFKALNALLGLALLGLAVWTWVDLLGIFYARYDYPMDIEWMEGGQLYHGYRVLKGLPLYSDCSDGFMPFAYPPVHAMALALVGKLFYLDYGAGRALSIVSFLGMVCILGGQVWRHCRDRGLESPKAVAFVAFAVTSVALSYFYTGHWYDMVRVDSLYLLFLCAGIAASFEYLEKPSGWRGAIFPATALVLAVYTKQTALLFLPWIGSYALCRQKGSAARLIGLVALGGMMALAALMVSTDGRFWTYVIQVMGRHQLIGFQAALHAKQTLRFAPYIPLVPFLCVYLLWRGSLSRRGGFWVGVGLSAMLASWVTAAKIGAYLNNLATIMSFAGVVIALLVVDLVRGRRPAAARAWLVVVGGLGFLVLLGARRANRPVLPSAEQRRAAKRLNSFVAELKGGVLMPGHAFLPVRNGHGNAQSHEQAYVDYMGSGLGDFDVVQCNQALEAKWLIINAPTNPYHLRLFAHAYQPHSRMPVDARTSVGMYTRPVMLLKRKQGFLVEKKRRRRRLLFDFEDGTYQGFSVQGNAFTLPTSATNGFQHPIAGIRGRYAASSFSPRAFDGATGWLESRLFRIDRERLGFRLGGGRSDKLAVELVVGGSVVKRLTTQEGLAADLEILLPVGWDVRSWRGEFARLRIVDASRRGWGHLMVDAVELYDPPVDAPQEP
jgi:hypothetical protein